MKYTDLLSVLKAANKLKPDYNVISDNLRKIKDEYRNLGDQDQLKLAWCFEQVVDIHSHYLTAFEKLKAENYYEAWREFETIEITGGNLARHFSVNDNTYHLKFILDTISKYQKLYPYKVFLSPEILELEKKCSICDKIVSIRNGCGHHVGEIYNGEICYRIVTKMELLGVAIVKSPLQKYSVAFAHDERTGGTIDNYNYSVIKYLVERLNDPFELWDFELQTRKFPQEHFNMYSANSICPCGSGEYYVKCCKNKDFVELPHYEFIFKESKPEILLHGAVSFQK